MSGASKKDSADAALHEPLLANPKAASLSDLRAAAVLAKKGFPIEVSAKHVLGEQATKTLATNGISLG